MTDGAGQTRAGDVRDGARETQHPVVAGSFVVSLVVLLVASARLCVHARMDEPWSLWLFSVAALCGGATWALAVRLQAEQRGLAAGRDAWLGSAMRGSRRHRRHVPINKTTTLHTQDGRQITARIANISVAAVAIDAKLSDLDYLMVLRAGSREVGPIRRTRTGAVFGFANLLDAQQFDKPFVL